MIAKKLLYRVLPLQWIFIFCFATIGHSQSKIQNLKNYFSEKEFQFHEIEGIGFEEGVTRRDPSDVIKMGTKYYVYYTKVYGRSPGYWGTIWAAVSEDEGFSWTEVGEVLGTGKKGEWDSQAVFTPNILEEDGNFYLYYTAVQPTPTNENGEFENNSANDYTAIGVARADNPLGPFERYSENPILTVSRNHELFDSYRVDDAVLLKKDGKFRLYYKGRKYTDGSSGPMHTQMGVAFADSPEGPFEKYSGNPILNKSHEVFIWRQHSGIACLASLSSTFEYSHDGLDFISNRVAVKVPAEKRPKAPGAFRPELTGLPPQNELSWGISMIHNGPNCYLVRWDLVEEQKKWVQYAEIKAEDADNQIIKKAANLVPSKRQMSWQELEFTCFICLGVNTFTDREWGTGKEDPAIFNPTQLDARQWCKVAKDAGMKLMLLTCKHHDGFCLWPSKYTDFSVASSSWKNGNGDVVKELATACKEFGLKLGIYLSPWDMNHPKYGTEAYNDYFVNQLTELLINYGPVAEVWFDGANGEGPNGKKQVYDWERYYQTIRELQPEAVIAIMGPDVRWVGTETGYGRETEWSVVPTSATEQDNIADNSQQLAGSGTFIPAGDRMAKDLGSREKILNADGLVWYPSEVDVSIRPGWYYHAREDSLVKSPEKLVDIYYSSLGRNSLLLLNLPPDKRGLIHENDIKSLMGMKDIIDRTFQTNLMEGAKVITQSINSNSAHNIIDGNRNTWSTIKNNQTDVKIEFDLGEAKVFDRVLLQENIINGQRVEHFSLESLQNNKWEQFTEGTTIGYKRMLRFDKVKAQKVRLIIHSSRDEPEISEIGLYKSP